VSGNAAPDAGLRLTRRPAVSAKAAAVLMVLLTATPAAGQVASPAAPGPYVIDLRGATSGLSTNAAFFPASPEGTNVPARGYGGEVGAHVYPLQLGIARLGVGVALMQVRGTASPAAPSSSTSSTSSATTPDVKAVLTVIVPQLSFNFGSAAGWSYLSAGVGRARVTSTTSAFGGTAAVGSSVTPAGDANTGLLQSLNFGGGARWFTKARLGVSFDVRVHMISAGGATDTRPPTPSTTVMAASAGISVR
jgi:hypothetical protein